MATSRTSSGIQRVNGSSSSRAAAGSSVENGSTDASDKRAMAPIPELPSVVSTLPWAGSRMTRVVSRLDLGRSRRHQLEDPDGTLGQLFPHVPLGQGDRPAVRLQRL